MADISSEDKDNAEALLRAFINENFPTIDTRKGTAFRSLVISPAAMFYALFQKEITELRQSQSLLDVNLTTADESVVEGIISNFLLSRNEGAKATGVIKVSASEDKLYEVSADTEFVTETDLVFTPLEALSFESSATESSSSQTLFSDPEEGTYFFLVPVESTSTTSEIVEQDTVLTLGETSFLDSAIFGLSAYITFSQGREKETIDEYKVRAQDSITVRDLVTDKSIRTVIQDNFPTAFSVTSIGYGDSEMLRDLVLPQGIHKGGSVDVYVRTDKVPPRSTIEKFITDNLSVELLSPETPVFKVDSIEIVTGNSLTLLTEGTDYTVAFKSDDPTFQSYVVTEITDYAARFSTKERVVITFNDSSLINSKVLLTITRPSTLVSIQEFTEDSENRVVCSNLLTKAYAPVFISMDISYRNTSVGEIVDVAAVKTAVSDYINSLAGENSTVEVSRIIDIVQNFSGIQSVVLPFTVEAEVHKPNGVVDLLSTTDKLEISTEKLIGFSQRVCQYILNPEDITLSSNG